MSLACEVAERAESGTPMRVGRSDRNPPGISFLDLVREDWETHDGDSLSPGFLALLVHRLGNRRMRVRTKALRAPLSLLYKTAYRAVLTLWGIDLPYTSQIGRRLRIAHHGAVFVGAWSIGDDVTIRHAVTIGLARRGANRSPIVGDRVELGPNACVVGNIVVGNDCRIGANTVVADDLPDGTEAIGNPARQRVGARATRVDKQP